MKKHVSIDQRNNTDTFFHFDNRILIFLEKTVQPPSNHGHKIEYKICYFVC